jgi:hypothetical protein
MASIAPLFDRDPHTGRPHLDLLIDLLADMARVHIDSGESHPSAVTDALCTLGTDHPYLLLAVDAACARRRHTSDRLHPTASGQVLPDLHRAICTRLEQT